MLKATELGDRLKIGEIFALDVNPIVRAQVRQDFGIVVFDTLDEALRCEPTAVLVASSTEQHLPVAMEAAKRDCHLFIEKPLSFSLGGVSRLCSEINSRKLVSMTACNMRFHPGPARVKELIEADAAGTLLSARIHVGSFLPDWRSGQDYRQSYSASVGAGGAVLDCIHEIDLALWYSGPADVVGSLAVPARSLALEADGLAEILLRHHSGSISSLHLNFVQQDYHRSCMIIGTKGTIYWDFNDGEVRVAGRKASEASRFKQPAQWQINQMYVDEMSHFLTAVAKRHLTVYPVEASVEALRIALVARQPMGPSI